MQIRLISSDGTYGHHRLQSLVESAGVHGLVAAARGPRDANAVAIDFAASEQIVDGSTIVIDLHSQQGLADGPKRAAVQGAVIGARSGLRVPLARSKSIDGQNKEAQLHQSQTAR